MKINEVIDPSPEIHNYDKLDGMLISLCKLVVAGKRTDPDRYGAVAAAVLDPDNRMVIGINLPGPNNTRMHAERVAMDRYKKLHGEIPNGSIVLTTCSPCSEHMHDRYGESCVDLINASPIKKVYCGFQDPTQSGRSRRFNEMETANASIRDLCRTFANTFMPYEKHEAGKVNEGGWDTKVTQNTVINPSMVKAALQVTKQFEKDFNQFLDARGIPPMKIGHPTGSSAYYQVDPEDKIYGDIDLQIIVPEVDDTAGKTMNQQQAYWNRLEDEFVKAQKPSYVHPDSEAGHPILKVGQDAWVQVDLMPHTEKLATWGRYRVTPERGVKGLLNGNMFSVFGEMLMMSIQHSGVQFKVRGKQKVPYVPTRKDYELVTLSTDIENFVMDIFRHEAHEQGITKGKIDPLLKQYPGSRLDEVKIANLVNAVKGFARSCELNSMFGKGDLANYSSAQDFLSRFWQIYEDKAMKDINAKKRDKAETPQAIARAEEDKKKVQQGLDYVRGLFNK